MYFKLREDSDDDPIFRELVARVITGVVYTEDPRRFAIIKIDNWFGSNWLGFRYKILGAAGAREFDAAAPNVLPPFIPDRVVSQSNFHVPDEDPEYKRTLRYLHRYQTSERNCGRQLGGLASELAIFWWSGRSGPNARGCLMAYLPGVDGHRGWYAGFKKTSRRDGTTHRVEWAPADLKGTNRKELLGLVEAADAG